VSLIPAVLGVACVALGSGAFLQGRRLRTLQRERFIRQYVFAESLLQTLGKHHPQLTEKDFFLVARALREFFLVRLRTGGRLIGMPSRVVDDLWHEFILDTREYHRFCSAAFGSFFHHVPAQQTVRGTDIDAAMRVTWRCTCLEENINPRRPTRLPLLFAIDEKLSVAGGNTYLMRETGDAAEAGRVCPRWRRQLRCHGLRWRQWQQFRVRILRRPQLRRSWLRWRLRRSLSSRTSPRGGVRSPRTPAAAA
jgi:hypothetical protein